MMTEMKKTALAARDAHLALLELKKLVDDATRVTHAAELEAFHLAISSHLDGEVRTPLRKVIASLRSADFETTLSQVRERLETAAS